MQKNELLRSYGKNFREMTIRLLKASDLIGDIRKKKAASGKGGSARFRIGIKPNLVCPTPADFGATTHPEIISGILEYLVGEGIDLKDITILEGSWVGDKTQEAFEYCGYNSLVREYPVELCDLQKDRRVVKTDCRGMELNICGTTYDMDYLINVPVLKGHCQTKITCALKNMKGLIPNSEKRRFHTMGLHKPIAHLNTGIFQDFIVIDHICGDPDFEEGGSPLVRNCIMTAKDPVLVDAYTCRVLGYEVDEIPYIRLAEKLGVGTTDLSKAVLRTIEGKPTKGEPADNADLTSADAVEGVPETRKLLDIAYAIEEIDSCSACFGSAVPALERLKNEGLLGKLTEKLAGDKIGIGQGYQGKTGKVGIGRCTKDFDFCVMGCPPDEDTIYEALKKYVLS